MISPSVLRIRKRTIQNSPQGPKLDPEIPPEYYELHSDDIFMANKYCGSKFLEEALEDERNCFFDLCVVDGGLLVQTVYQRLPRCNIDYGFVHKFHVPSAYVEEAMVISDAMPMAFLTKLGNAEVVESRLEFAVVPRTPNMLVMKPSGSRLRDAMDQLCSPNDSVSLKIPAVLTQTHRLPISLLKVRSGYGRGLDVSAVATKINQLPPELQFALQRYLIAGEVVAPVSTLEQVAALAPLMMLASQYRFQSLEVAYSIEIERHLSPQFAAANEEAYGPMALSLCEICREIDSATVWHSCFAILAANQPLLKKFRLNIRSETQTLGHDTFPTLLRALAGDRLGNRQVMRSRLADEILKYYLELMDQDTEIADPDWFTLFCVCEHFQSSFKWQVLRDQPLCISMEDAPPHITKTNAALLCLVLCGIDLKANVDTFLLAPTGAEYLAPGKENDAITMRVSAAMVRQLYEGSFSPLDHLSEAAREERSRETLKLWGARLDAFLDIHFDNPDWNLVSRTITESNMLKHYRTFISYISMCRNCEGASTFLSSSLTHLLAEIPVFGYYTQNM